MCDHTETNERLAFGPEMEPEHDGHPEMGTASGVDRAWCNQTLPGAHASGTPPKPNVPMKNLSAASSAARLLPFFALACHGLGRAELLVDLDATTLPAGPLVSWTNAGTLGGAFTRQIDTPLVTTVNGIKGVTLDGTNDWYVGPAAPASITGNGSRTMIAWLHNPSIGQEETIIAWGRRGGGNGTNAAYTHGTHPVWGAVGQWGDVADMSWKGAERAGVWTCVAVSYDGATLTSSIYTDGLPGVAEMNGPLNTWALDTNNNPLPIVVGSQNNPNGTRGAVPASFTLARVQLHGRALSAAEIADIHNTAAPVFGLTPVEVKPSLVSLNASHAVVYQGDPVTLSWQVQGADSLVIDPGGVAATGQSSMALSPTATTTYRLRASNASGEVSSMVTVIVDPGAPTALGQTVNVAQGGSSPVTLQGDDPNTPQGSWSWTVVTPPANGSLSGTAPALTYTPNPGFAGIDSFSFLINDGLNDSETAAVTLRVLAPPTDPAGLVTPAYQVLTNFTAGSFVGLLKASDPNLGETHTFQLAAGAGDTDNFRFSVSGNQLIYQGDTPPAGGILSVRVLVTDSTGRSAGQVVSIPVVTATPSVVINELHYDPPGNARTEFVELHNPGTTPVNISGWRFSRGVGFTFPPGSTIAAGGFVVVAMDPAVFQAEYGFTPYGPFTGALAGEGETVELVNASSVVIDTVTYKDEFPWPVGVSGGSSMELIHPSLDNDLGGSWRSSVPLPGLAQLDYVPAASNGWSYKPGTSMPPSNWRDWNFTPDGTWINPPTPAPIGYGEIDNLPLGTTLAGMQGSHISVFARKTFDILPGEIPSAVLLRFTIDDGVIIWINGVEVARHNVSGTGQNPDLNTTANANGTEGLWYDVLRTDASQYLREGTNVIALRAFNRSLSDSGDFAFDARLIRPAGDMVKIPSPGAVNTVYSPTAPPQIRQVDHQPKSPVSGEPIRVTAKISDPQGVGAVNLLYQIVEPGQFIPARFPRGAAQILADPGGERPVNPAFENPANWTAMAMTDNGANGDESAGDAVFTAFIPAQAHRTLVRYRIVAADIPGTSVQVPYADDASLNFACFVYDGVPDYVASAASVSPEGPGKVWPRQVLESLPVYHWIIRNEDMLALQAYEGAQQMPNTGNDTVLAARRAEDWEGAFVCDGVVYDHVVTRLRGGNSRYGDNEGRFTRGKRHYKFQFNDGHRFQARDQAGKKHPVKWSSLAVNKMFGNKGGNGWGMPEEIGATLWNTFGVPAPSTHWFHFRVIDGAAEAPDQYNGDFWGIQQVVEEYESSFMDARGMTKGNLYKMSDWIWDSERQRRYQSPNMVRDGSEFNNIRDNLHGGQSGAWLNEHVNYQKWYRYSAVAEAIRHYDLFPYTDDIRHSLKNCAWYFEPVGSDPSRGVCWWLPYDWDASFGPNWNNGWEHANNALYGWDMSTSDGMPYVNKPAMKLEHRNVIREFRDLIWQEDQINRLMDDRAAVIAEISKADQDRWRDAPLSAGTANDDPLASKVADMKRFCFESWSREENIGPFVPAGRGAHLDNLADGPDAGLLPATPVITYTGPPDHPRNGLAFSTSAFSDPQGAGTFGAMAWRLGEIENPAAPGWKAEDAFILEYNPVWQTGALNTFSGSVSIPPSAVKAGHTYRARVRMMDNTGRWSHWSAPYEFTATAADGFIELRDHLMITELMYNPAGPAPVGGSKEDYEYIELRNIGSTLTLDLTNVAFTEGLQFSFAGSAITSLAPGAHAVIVKNLAAFVSRYGAGRPVAGEWNASSNLANNGERIRLAYTVDGSTIHDFTYDDAPPWPTEPDGNGPALVLANPASAPDHSLAASWTSGPPTPGTSADPFGEWLAALGETDPMAEFAPGLSHLMAYALGAELLPHPTDALPAAGFTDVGEHRHLTLTFRRRILAFQVTYTAETSLNLGTWQSGSGIMEMLGSPVDNGDGTETVTFLVLAPVSENPARFVRLRAVLAD